VQPLVSAFAFPRRNTSVNTSARQVKLSFADNLFINVMPPRPGDGNGSDRIENHPDLSAALKQCARLRRKFLRYFVEGTFIGDCILSRACRNAHVASYVLGKKALVIVVNKGRRRVVRPVCNIRAWLDSRSEQYVAKLYDEAGKLRRTVGVSRSRPISTHALSAWEIGVIEIMPK
jgi:hypothetical protein